jgi:hypothetical protein
MSRPRHVRSAQRDAEQRRRLAAVHARWDREDEQLHSTVDPAVADVAGMTVDERRQVATDLALNKYGQGGPA